MPREREALILAYALHWRYQDDRRYQTIVTQDVRPLWVGALRALEQAGALKDKGPLSRVLAAIRQLDPGSDVAEVRRYCDRIDAIVFTQLRLRTRDGAAPGGRSHLTIDAAGRELDAAFPGVADVLHWPAPQLPGPGAPAGFTLDVTPTLIMLTHHDEPVPAQDGDARSPLIESVSLTDGMALDEAYWRRLRRAIDAAIDQNLAALRRQAEVAYPERTRPSTRAHLGQSLDLLFRWLFAHERPPDRANRQRARRVAAKMGLLVPPD